MLWKLAHRFSRKPFTFRVGQLFIAHTHIHIYIYTCTDSWHLGLCFLNQSTLTFIIVIFYQVLTPMDSHGSRCGFASMNGGGVVWWWGDCRAILGCSCNPSLGVLIARVSVWVGGSPVRHPDGTMTPQGPHPTVPFGLFWEDT